MPNEGSDDKVKAFAGDGAANLQTQLRPTLLKIRVRFPGGVFRDVECPPEMTMGDFCKELSEQFKMRGDFYMNLMLSGERVSGTYFRNQEPFKDEKKQQHPLSRCPEDFPTTESSRPRGCYSACRIADPN
jgi:hypothetical protein